MDFVWIKPKSCFVTWEKHTKNSILFIQIPSLTFYICSGSLLFLLYVYTITWVFFWTIWKQAADNISSPLTVHCIFPQNKDNIPPFKSGNQLWYRYYHTVHECCLNFASYPNNAFFSFWFRILSKNTCNI